MFRYIGLIWDVADPSGKERAARCGRQLIEPSGGWNRVAHVSGLQVYCHGGRSGSLSAHPLARESGVVLGTVFDSGRALRDQKFSETETDEILESQGRTLLDSYWGRYVGFVADSSQRTVWVVKDPTGRGRGSAEAHSHSYGTLWLSPGVHVCKLNSTVVVLDLTTDRYLAIGGETLQTLAAMIPGWPKDNSDEPNQSSGRSRDIPKYVLELISEGVLTTNGALGKAATPLRFDSRAGSIALTPNITRRRKIRISDVLKFVWACVSTIWVLRCGSLQKAVERVAEGKRGRGRDVEFDVAIGRDLIAIFRRLRSFTFSAHRRCLFHALVLVDFLSRYGLYPQFVMGVKIDPWAAHSWVQAGEFILDGTPEEVRFFTPIFAI